MKAIDEAEKKGLVAPIAIQREMVRREYSSLANALAAVGPDVEMRLSGRAPSASARRSTRPSARRSGRT